MEFYLLLTISIELNEKIFQREGYLGTVLENSVPE